MKSIFVALIAIVFSTNATAANTHTLDEIKNAPSVTLNGLSQFRMGQVMGWCVESAECREKLREEMQRPGSPWAEVSKQALPMLDDPQAIEAQQLQWTKDANLAK